MSKYGKLIDGEWFAYDSPGVRIACCHCSLIHDIVVRKRGGKIELKLTQNPRATQAMRRKLKRVIIVEEDA